MFGSGGLSLLFFSLSSSERFVLENSSLPLVSSAKYSTSIPRTHVRMSKRTLKRTMVLTVSPGFPGGPTAPEGPGGP